MPTLMEILALAASAMPPDIVTVIISKKITPHIISIPF